MASADERPPLATLTTAHAASNEVSERRGREGWCARSLSDLVERATATQSFVIYTPHELHTTFPRATRELRARLNIDVTLNVPSPRALAPQKPTAQTTPHQVLYPLAASAGPAGWSRPAEFNSPRGLLGPRPRTTATAVVRGRGHRIGMAVCAAVAVRATRFANTNTGPESFPKPGSW